MSALPFRSPASSTRWPLPSLAGFKQLAGEIFATDTQETTERLIIAGLDGEGRVKHWVECRGARQAVDLSLQDLDGMLSNPGVRFIALAHNHPSGTPLPSKSDVEATFTLAEMCERAGLPLIDHLIFGGGEVHSIFAGADY